MFRKTFKKGKSCVASAKQGFSLVELLVVITIIAILSVAAYMAVGGQTIKAKNSRRMNDLATLQTALEIYAVNNGNLYPDAINTTNLPNSIISKIPKDPSGANYAYATNSTKRQYQLATTIEDEKGGADHKSYIIGNGSNLISGCSNNGVTGVCSGTCTVTDNTSCLPYAL